MASVNKAIIVGNLGQDPELRYSASGSAVCSLSVATNEKWKDKDGKLQERTEWHRVSVWNKQAEACAQYLAKGRLVYVEGRIETREYKDREGVTRKATQIVATNVTFLGGGDGDQGGRGGRPSGGGRGRAKGPVGEPEDFRPAPDGDDIPF